MHYIVRMKKFFIVLVVSLYPLSLFSQNTEQPNSSLEIIISNDKISSIQENLRNKVVDLLSSATKTNAYLNGREYFPYFTNSPNSPLYQPENERMGSIFYEGKKYDSLNLHYDTYIDGVILLHTNDEGSMEMILLNDNYIDSFRLDLSDHSISFRKRSFPLDEKQENIEGYFQVLYDGNIKYMIRHKSEKVKFNLEDRYNYEYEPEEYICMDSALYPVHSRRSFLRNFEKEERSRIKKIMKENSIRISRRDLSRGIINVLKYYDSMK